MNNTANKPPPTRAEICKRLRELADEMIKQVLFELQIDKHLPPDTLEIRCKSNAIRYSTKKWADGIDGEGKND